MNKDKNIPVDLLTRSEEIKSVDGGRLYRKIDRTIEHNYRRKRRMRGLRITAAAVMAAAMAGTGIFLSGTMGRGTHSGMRISDNVVLTLPGGEQFSWDADNNADAQIAMCGGISLLSQDGILIHKPSGVDAATYAGSQAGEIVFGNIYIPRGAFFDMVLADGTHIWLNADSRLYYPLSFGGGERRVKLEGEAYFQVAKDPDKPFVVETEIQQITVLGTEFNVYAYDSEQITTLAEGSISLAYGERERLVLRPGQQAILSDGGHDVSVKEINVANASAWRNGMLAVDGNTLGEIFRKLSRWYDADVTYEFESPEIENLVLRGNIPLLEHVDQVYDIMAASGKVELDIKGHKVKIRKLR